MDYLPSPDGGFEWLLLTSRGKVSLWPVADAQYRRILHANAILQRIKAVEVCGIKTRQANSKDRRRTPENPKGDLSGRLFPCSPSTGKSEAPYSEATYKEYDYLNYRALNYNAKWQWAIGKRISGEIFFQRSQALASFTDYNSYAKRNLRTTEDNRFSLDYWLHSNWHLIGSAYTTKLTNETAYLEDSDYDGTGYSAGLSYQPASGNKLTWQVKRMEGQYKKRQFNLLYQYDNGFTQSGQQLELYWQLTGKSALRGSLEYVNREHDHFSTRDYAGWIGNLNYIYSYSGKTTLTAGYRRGLDSYQQLVSSYYRSNEFNLVGQWAPTSKIVTSARVAYIQRQYQGAIISLPDGYPERDDKVARLGFDVSYRPDRWLELKAGTTIEKRISNVSNYEYNDRLAYISANGQF